MAKAKSTPSLPTTSKMKMPVASKGAMKAAVKTAVKKMTKKKY